MNLDLESEYVRMGAYEQITLQMSVCIYLY
jgi:hypothetical protein